MRREYQKPCAVRIEIGALEMLATSTTADVPAKPGEEPGAGVRMNRGEWGNLWSK